MDWTFNDDSEGWFEIRSEICQACRARELHQHDHKGERQDPGTVEYIVNMMSKDTKLRPRATGGATP